MPHAPAPCPMPHALHKPAALLCIHTPVDPSPAHKLLMSAGLRNCSLVQDNDPVGQTDIREPVTDKQGCPPFHDLPEPAEDLILGICIQRTRRLIKDQHRGIPVKRSRQGYLLPLSPAQLPAVVKKIADSSIITIRQRGNQFINTRRPCRCPYLRIFVIIFLYHQALCSLPQRGYTA